MLGLCASSSNAQVYLFLENLIGLNDLDLDFVIMILVEKYLFQLIALLNPDFNCCNNFALSWVDKVTTGTKRFASVISNARFWFQTLV